MPCVPRLAAVVVLALAACANPAIRPDAGPADRIAAECALLAEARERMPALPAGSAEGCPGIAARDTRPLSAQVAALRAANAAVLPPGIEAGTRADTVFRRLITRGVSVALAAELATTPDFARATR